jgi:hypothetical protein
MLVRFFNDLRGFDTVEYGHKGDDQELFPSCINSVSSMYDQNAVVPAAAGTGPLRCSWGSRRC